MNNSVIITTKEWLQNSLGIPYHESNRILQYEMPLKLPGVSDKGDKFILEFNEKQIQEKFQVAKDLGQDLNNLGLSKGREGLWEEALVIWSDALTVQKCALTIDIASHGKEYSDCASDVACTLNNIGIAMFWLNRLEMGLIALNEALCARQLQSKDANVIMDMDLAMTYHNIGNFRLRMHDYNGALVIFKVELRIKFALYNNEVCSSHDDYRCTKKVHCDEKDICLVYTSMGNTYMKLGQFQDAKTILEEVVYIYRSMGMSDDHPEVMSALNNNAKCSFYETRAKGAPRV